MFRPQIRGANQKRKEQKCLFLYNFIYKSLFNSYTLEQGKSQFKKADNLAEIRKYAFDAIRFWYMFVLALGFAMGYAYYINRYAPRVYPIGMSLLIRSQSDLGNSAAMLYSNPMIEAVPNHLDQAHLIKADPLLQKVIEKVNFKVSYFQEGKIKTSEYYPGLPIDFVTDAMGEQLPYGSSFWIQLSSESHFYFKEKRPDESEELTAVDLHAFGEPIKFGNYTFRVIKGNGFNHSNFYKEPLVVNFSTPTAVARGYSGRLNIQWVERGSGLLKLNINGTTPQKEVDFLNTLAETFIEQDVQEKSQNASKTIDFINEQLAEISDSLFRVENRLEQFKEKNYQATLSEKSIRIFERLQELEGDRAMQGLRLRYYDYLTDYIRNGKGGSDLVVPASIGIEDPLLNSLMGKMVELQLNREELSRNTNQENPYLQGVDAQLADLRKNIVENVDNQKRNILLDQKKLGGEIQELERKIRTLPAAEREYVNIKRLYDLSEGLYVFLMQKRAEAGITKASTTSDVTVVNPAKLMGGPISPDTGKNYVMAVLIGLAFPFGFIFIKRFFNDKIQTRDELLELTAIPFLGVVGHKNDAHTNLVLLDSPKSSVAESFRSVRSNIEFFTSGDKEKKNRTIVITSSISGEGKTFCSINLATVYALSGNKTLLIGADLRKPKIYQDFSLLNDAGLSNYLAMQVSVEKVIQKTHVANLDIISGGIIPPNPSELLMSHRMKELMKILQQEYKYIIIDTPPVGLVADAFALMGFADHSVFVVRQNYTRMEFVNNLQGTFETGKIKDASILLNDQKVNSYGYGYGYGYYDDGAPVKRTLWKRILKRK